MPNPLALLLSDTQFPSNEPAHSGGIEEACATGMVGDINTLGLFLHGRLHTTGALAAHVAAAVCFRASHGPVPDSLWRTVQSEIDARILSPVARATSRQQGAHLLRLALNLSPDRVLASLARATLGAEQQPHHAVALGAVAAAGGATPQEAASAGAYASVAGPAYAALQLLGLTPAEVGGLASGLEMAVHLLSVAAAEAAPRSLSELPSCGAPALEYLAEEHAGREASLFAS